MEAGHVGFELGGDVGLAQPLQAPVSDEVDDAGVGDAGDQQVAEVVERRRVVQPPGQERRAVVDQAQAPLGPSVSFLGAHPVQVGAEVGADPRQHRDVLGIDGLVPRPEHLDDPDHAAVVLDRKGEPRLQPGHPSRLLTGEAGVVGQPAHLEGDPGGPHPTGHALAGDEVRGPGHFFEGVVIGPTRGPEGQRPQATPALVDHPEVDHVPVEALADGS